MIQNFYDTYPVCIECNEGIFNPICPSCLSKEFEVWLKSNNLGMGTIVKNKIRRELQKIIKQNFTAGQKCIVCKKNNSFICPYCFTEEIFEILKEIHVNKKFLEEFFTFFNYDFDHKGYSRELENI